MKQLLFTKGPQGPIGATLGTAMNNFCSSSNKESTHYITWLFSFWIWRRRCLKFAWFWPFGALPLGPHGGHTYYLNNFESPTPKDDSCHFWLKSNHAFSKRRWNSYFLQRAHRGPLGPPWELPWTTFVLHLTRYLHTTYLDYSPSGSGEEDVWNLHGFGPLGPSPWAPMGATHTIWTTLNPLPLRMIPAKFG